MMKPLTQQAQDFIAAHVSSGETVIDATAGNGHDTLFLAQLVGTTGHVFAFDVQTAALQKTGELLGANCREQVTLKLCSHAQMLVEVPALHHGCIAAIMFNLGYLPGGDKEKTTRTETTQQALQQSLLLLKPEGVLSVLAYPGHTAGAAETRAVQQFFAERTEALQVTHRQGEKSRKQSPELFLGIKKPFPSHSPQKERVRIGPEDCSMNECPIFDSNRNPRGGVSD